MTMIDYRKAHDLVHIHGFWNVQERLMIGVAQNIVTLKENSMENWKTVLTSNQEVLGTVDIKNGRRLISTSNRMD